MEVRFCGVFPIKAFWNEPWLRCVRTIVALVLFATTSQITFGTTMEEEEPDCAMTTDSYALVRYYFHSVDVSDSYTRAISDDEHEIIRGYLADDSEAQYYCFYYYPEDAGKPLDLHYEVRRGSDEVFLSIHIYA